MTTKIKYYRRKHRQPMYPWFSECDMDGISVSQTDKNQGSPKLGDMIAINPDDPSDQWLVGEKYFKENYEEDWLTA